MLKLMFSTSDARLVWATRGEERIKWNNLIDDERRIALLLLQGFMLSQLAPAFYKDAHEFAWSFRSCRMGHFAGPVRAAPQRILPKAQRIPPIQAGCFSL